VKVDLSIIIVNWNTADLAQACIDSIFATPPACICEIILVDNGSSDGSAQRFAADPRIRLLAKPTNLGFAKASNLAIQESQGEHVLLLNSDTRAQAQALEQCLALLRSDACVGLVGCALLNPDGSVQRSCSFFPTPLTPLLGRAVFRRLRTRLLGSPGRLFDTALTDEEHARDQRPDWIMGAFMMARRRDIEQVGLLDEGFFMYAEDMDWCYRFRRHGLEVAYLASARIVHLGGGSSRLVPRETIERRVRSEWRFMLKHHGRIPAACHLAARVASLVIELSALSALALFAPKPATADRIHAAVLHLASCLRFVHRARLWSVD
jgi:N-acetylglucosaminyl-diphospho-decaprenol L-rhamnosyltransferase